MGNDGLHDDTLQNLGRVCREEDLMSKLKILSGPESGRTVLLEPGSILNIGRNPPTEGGEENIATLVIEEKRVSRLHCQVVNEGGKWVLRDLKSSNGTFVNGERVPERVLRAGDLLQVGSVVLELIGEEEKARPPPPEAQPQPEPTPSESTWSQDESAPEPPGEEEAKGEREAARQMPASAKRALPVAGALGALLIALGVAAYLFLGSSTPHRSFETASKSQKSPSTLSALRPAEGPSPAPPSAPETNLVEKPLPAQPVEAAVEARLRQGEYRLALAVLEDPSRGQQDSDTLKLRDRIQGAAQSEVEATAREADGLSLEGDFDSARAKLEALLGRAPDELSARILSAIEQVQRVEESCLDHEKKSEKELESMRMLLASLDFPGAERAAKALTGGDPSRGDEKSKAFTALLLKLILEEVRLAGGAWERLSSIVDKKIAQKETLSISFAPPPQDQEATRSSRSPPETCRLIQREKDQLTLRKTGGPAKEGNVDRVITLFSLADPVLQTLMSLEGLDASRRQQVLEGLGLLLLYRSGPRRAEPYLSATSIPKSRRRTYLSLMESASEIWLLSRFEDLCTLFRALSEKKSQALPQWEDFCAQITELVRNWRHFPGYAPRRDMLFDLFVRGKTEIFKLGGVEKLFHARRIELKGEQLHLSYDFTSDDQFKDFYPVPRGAPGLRRDGNSLRLKGECQLLRGDPFQGSLFVKGKVPANGFDPASPNINIAFFTSSKDQLTFTDKRPTSFFGLIMGARGEEPNDYIVFALGYKVVVTDFGGRPMEELRVVGNPNAVRLPAHAILAGKRGQPLHVDPRECLSAAPVGGAMPPGGVSFEARVDGDKITWTLNGMRLASEKDQLLKPPSNGAERSGSLTLFTHASEVKFSLLEIEGKLKKGWADQHVRAEALQELRGLDPHVK